MTCLWWAATLSAWAGPVVESLDLSGGMVGSGKDPFFQRFALPGALLARHPSGAVAGVGGMITFVQTDGYAGAGIGAGPMIGFIGKTRFSPVLLVGATLDYREVYTVAEDYQHGDGLLVAGVFVGRRFAPASVLEAGVRWRVFSDKGAAFSIAPTIRLSRDVGTTGVFPGLWHGADTFFGLCWAAHRGPVRAD